MGLFSRSPVRRMADAGDVDGLTALLNSKAPKERAAAANALGGLGVRAAGAERALLAALDDPEDNVRGQVVFALGEIRSTAAWDRLERLLGDDDWSIRLFAVNALSFIDPVRALPTIAPLANDSEELVREQVELCRTAAE